MNNNFLPFDRYEFEQEIRTILKALPSKYLRKDKKTLRDVPAFLTEITNKSSEGFEPNEIVTWEKVYKIPTSNWNKHIVIFSSILIESNQTRECGEDRVRLVIRLKENDTFHYWKHKKHNRVENLLKKTLSKSIEYAQQRANEWLDINSKDCFHSLRSLLNDDEKDEKKDEEEFEWEDDVLYS